MKLAPFGPAIREACSSSGASPEAHGYRNYVSTRKNFSTRGKVVLV